MSDRWQIFKNGALLFDSQAFGPSVPPEVLPPLTPPVIPPVVTPPVTNPGYPTLGNPGVSHVLPTGIYAMPVGVSRGTVQLSNENTSPGMIYEWSITPTPGDFSKAQMAIASGGAKWAALANPNAPEIMVIPLGAQYYLNTRRKSGDDNGLQVSWSSNG
jgi:hypothetical protein